MSEQFISSLTSVTRHPLVLLVWLILGAVLDWRMDWLPKPDSILTKVAPLMGFALVMVPIVGFAEYWHRPTWTRLLRETVGAPDMVAIDAFYHLDPKSAMIVFEHNNEVSGVVAIDGKKPGEELGSVLGAEEKQKGDISVMEKSGLGGAKSNKSGLRQRGKKDAARSNIVQIRHLDVDHPLRRQGVATELLAAALDHAFNIAPLGSAPAPAETVIILSNPFTPGGEKLLKKFGFTVSASNDWPQPKSVGLLQWKGRYFELSRTEWASRRDAILKRA